MTETHTRRGPGRPRNADVDAAILEAALDLLIERGVEAVSIEQVAQRAGVTRATVYRRFANKEELLVAAIGVGQEPPVEVPEPVDLEQMVAVWAAHLSMPRLRRLTRRLMAALEDHPELRKAYYDASVKQREQAVRAALERARARGQLAPDADLEILREILTGAVAVHLTSRPDTSTAHEIEGFLLAVLRQAGYRGNR